MIGTVEGTLWHDDNANGDIDAGEPALVGGTVYLDDNLNGQLDPGEVTAWTDASGNYSFTGIADGRHVIAAQPQAGYHQVTPTTAVVPPDGSDPNGVYVDKMSQVDLAAFNAFSSTAPASTSSWI